MGAPITNAELDELDEDEAPKRRGRPAFAFPAEAIPPEVNAAFLADLEFERAISTALGLANSLSAPDDLSELAIAVLQPAEAAL
jgi:hypothetical protein